MSSIVNFLTWGRKTQVFGGKIGSEIVRTIVERRKVIDKFSVE